MKTNAVFIEQTGGPEVLQWGEVDVGDPGPGQARVENKVIGLNYIDTTFRQGFIPLPHMPAVLGAEASAVVTAVGEGVDYLKPGDRVAYSAGFGSYCQERVMAADRLVHIPDGIDDKTAAGAFSKGTTAEFLLLRAYPRAIGVGDTVLIHAAAGGVGSIMSQWASHLGATVIGTAGSDTKVKSATDNGCDYGINYNTENFVERVKEITGGSGVPVVFDPVGKDTFEGSLDCLAARGFLVCFGQASGLQPLVDPTVLMQKGSLYVTRASLFDYNATRADLVASGEALFSAILAGGIEVNVNQTYDLRDAAQAHRDLAERKLTGSTILIP
jgi:NADPH:quinone reductase